MKTPHYFAICRSNDGTHFITNEVYPDDETARRDNPMIYVRLAVEIPPLVIDTSVSEAPKVKAKITQPPAQKPWQKKKR